MTGTLKGMGGKEAELGSLSVMPLLCCRRPQLVLIAESCLLMTITTSEIIHPLFLKKDLVARHSTQRIKFINIFLHNSCFRDPFRKHLPTPR